MLEVKMVFNVSVHVYKCSFELFLLMWLHRVAWKKSSLKSYPKLFYLWFGCPVIIGLWNSKRIPAVKDVQCAKNKRIKSFSSVNKLNKNNSVFLQILLISGDCTGYPVLNALASFSECGDFLFVFLRFCL